MAKELPGYQRKHLRGLAHKLKPVVLVGNDGITKEVVSAVERALLDHELVKVRMHEPDDKKAMAEELTSRTHAHLCGLVGHTAILYRPHPDEPVIQLPKRSS